jgi:hypothetical protein
MYKFYTIILLAIFLGGCGDNPVGPHVRNYTSFYGFLNTMDDPIKVYDWIQAKTTYDIKFRSAESEGSTYVQRLARFLFYNKKGTCGNDAALYTYAATWHKYEAGIIIIGKYDNKPSHALSWIKQDGKITIADRSYVLKGRFNNFDELIKYYTEDRKMWLFIYYNKNKRRNVMLETLSMFTALIFMILCQIPIMTVQIVWDLMKLGWIKMSMFVQCKINDWKFKKLTKYSPTGRIYIHGPEVQKLKYSGPKKIDWRK